VQFEVAGDHSESMDARLRRVIETAAPAPGNAMERSEHLAILARWFYSSWRDGIWIDLDSGGRVPYRRMVSAISRTVHQSAPAASD
jgi:hypothetical protein